jgi:hypothetical protein
MKVCPKCQSTYSDETLNFCLTDGSPLVVEEALADHLSREGSWHTAETLLDPKFSAPEQTTRQTAVNHSSPTLPLFPNETEKFSKRNKSSRKVYSILGVLLAAVALGGGFWWFSKSPNVNNPVISADVKPSTPKRVVEQLSVEQEAQVTKEITDFLESWRATNERKDADAHLTHYASTLEIYYGESGKDKNHVLADRLRAYQRYDSISLQIDKLKITPESADSATAVFDKSWTMKNAQKTSTGSVQQEMHLSQTGGKWLIDSERDLKVYFINNRENQTDENANQASQNSNKANEPAK